MTTPPKDPQPQLPSSLPSPLRPEMEGAEPATVPQVRKEIAARERDIQYHIDALKHEALTVFDDVIVDGRPLMDRIRERKEEAILVAAGAGAFVGMLFGLRARVKRRVDPEDTVDFIRARLAVALDEAAEEVAEGREVEVAIRRAMRKLPVAYGEGPGEKRPHRSSGGVYGRADDGRRVRCQDGARSGFEACDRRADRRGGCGARRRLVS